MMDKKKHGQVRTGRGHDMRGQDITGKYMTGQNGSGKVRTNKSPTIGKEPKTNLVLALSLKAFFF